MFKNWFQGGSCRGWVFLFLGYYAYSLEVEKEINPNFEYWADSRDPWVGVAVMMNEIGGIQCQRGYYNQSDTFIDAVYHCANLEHTRRSRKTFSERKVDWGGETPMLCLKTCIARESGAMNDQNNGLDRERTRALFFEGMLQPGGNMTARVMTEELIECHKKHPTEFPMDYKNCTNTEELFRCYGQAFHNCRDRKDTGDKDPSGSPSA